MRLEHVDGKGMKTILAVYVLLASAVTAATVHVLHTGAIKHNLARQMTTPKYLVLLVLDGARPDYFGLTPLPHIDALRQSGTQFTQGMAGLLEAETPSGHAAIATGSRPDHNGILGFDWANDNDRYSLFSPDRMGNLVQLMQDAHAPTIAGLYKQRYPSAKVVALSGHKYYAAAPLGGPQADAIMYYQGDPQGRYVPVAVPGHMPPASVLNAPGLVYPTIHTKDGVENHLATKLALASVKVMHPRIMMINYPEFDWPLGHVYGGNLDQTAVITDMQMLDADLGSIEDAYRAAGILNQTLFVITADHGMMPINRWIPSGEITGAIAHAGTTTPNLASSTGDYIWLADKSKAQTVAENILNIHDVGIQSCYYLTTTNGISHYVAAKGVSLSEAGERANQYLLGALLNGREPSVVVFANEGASFSDPKTNWKADHGGNSWQSQNMPLILSGPGIRAGVVTNAPAQLEDIAPTVLTDMGVKPTGMYGHVLTDALLQSSTARQRARVAELTQIKPVVKALTVTQGTTSAGTS